MSEKKIFQYNPLVLMGSGLIILCSEFLSWVGDYSAWELIFIPGIDTSAMLYLIPIFAGVLSFSAGVGLLINNRPKEVPSRLSPYLRYWIFVSFLLGLNLTIFYLTQLFLLHGNYLWQNVAIYVLIAGLICWFLGIILVATQGTEDKERVEK